MTLRTPGEQPCRQCVCRSMSSSCWQTYAHTCRWAHGGVPGVSTQQQLPQNCQTSPSCNSSSNSFTDSSITLHMLRSTTSLQRSSTSHTKPPPTTSNTPQQHHMLATCSPAAADALVLCAHRRRSSHLCMCLTGAWSRQWHSCRCDDESELYRPMVHVDGDRGVVRVSTGG